MKPARHILPTIVFAQFCGTSLWFSGNAVMPGLISDFYLNQNAVAHLTTAVQLGFIVGTLLFAIFAIADRFSPSRVFLVCAITGALFNVAMIWQGNTLSTLLLLRFLTGFFLAGIYPVGMKIAADYFDKGLGRSLGYLVGALVLGTAFPHLLGDVLSSISWQTVMIITSCTAVFGGILLQLLVPDGPYRKAGSALSFKQLKDIFKDPNFNKAALGYIGHMWELYTFWTLVPAILIIYLKQHPATSLSVSLYSFIIIGAGSIACIAGGYRSQKIGVQKMAKLFLLLSGMCCLIAPLILRTAYYPVVIVFLIFWGMVVIADSPLFSALVAQRAAPSVKGTALTMVNCIGFAITIISIQTLVLLQSFVPLMYALPLLAIGPVFGLLAMRNR
ncbi:nitrate/nitrite transporter [Dokdonia sp. LLG6352-1]|uniref:MFS transporter n=1 Tax=Dokdonia sp. LLG6352-1 TaxID=3160831 RepID=UPI00386DC194